MYLNWFNRKGYLLYPATLWAWLMVVGVAGYLVYTFIEIDSHSHSVSDTFINWFFNVLVISVALYFFALMTTEKKPSP